MVKILTLFFTLLFFTANPAFANDCSTAFKNKTYKPKLNNDELLKKYEYGPRRWQNTIFTQVLHRLRGKPNSYDDTEFLPPKSRKGKIIYELAHRSS